MEELKAIIQRMMDNGESQDKIRETVRLYKEQNPEKFKVEGKTDGDVTGADATPKKKASGIEESTDLELEGGSSEFLEPARQDNTLVNFGFPEPIHDGEPSVVPELTAQEFEDLVNNLPPTPELEERINKYPRQKKIEETTGLWPSQYPTVNTGDTEVTALNALKGLFGETKPEETPVSKTLELEEMETLMADMSESFNNLFEGMLSSEVSELQNIQEDSVKYEDKIKSIEDQAFNELAKKYPGLSKKEFQNIAKVGNRGLFQQALDNQVSKYNKIKSKANREGGLSITDEEFEGTMWELDSRLSPKMKKKKDIETAIREKNRELNSTNDPLLQEVLKGEIALLQDDKAKLATIQATTDSMGEQTGMFGSEESVDPVLAGSYMEYETTKYQAGKREEATKTAEATVPVMLEGLMNSNKTMTGFEAFESLLKGKTAEKKRLIAYGDTETVSLKGFRRMPELYNQLKTLGLVNDKSGNLVDVPINDLYDLGYDVRDFESMLNFQGGGDILSEEAFNKLANYEDAMYRVEGEMKTIHDQAYVNIDPATIDHGGGLTTFAQAAGVGVLTTFTDKRREEAIDIVAGPNKDRTASYMLEKFEEIVPVFNEENKDKIEAGEIDELGFTKDEMKAIEKSFGEEIGEGVGHFVPMLVELGVLSAATGTVMSVPTIARGLATLRGGSGFQKATYHAIMAMIEEGKMYTVGMGATTGSSFYAGGQLTSGLTPFKNRFKWMDPLYQKVIKGGAVGAASSQLAVASEAAWDDLTGDRDFQAVMDDHFGDLEFKDIITEAIVFSIVGATHSKKSDFMRTKDKYDAVAELTKSMQDLMPLEGREKMSQKDKSKYDAYYDAKTKLEQQIMVETSALELDPNSKDFQKNFDARYTKPMEAAIQAVIPEYKGAEVKFVEGRKQMIEEGNAAEFREGEGTDGKDLILMDKNSYTPGKTVHEFTHMAMENYFKKNPGMEAKFTKKMETLFKDFNFEAFEGTKLEEFIKEGYKIDGGTTKGKSLAAREYLAYMTELLSNPKIYNQKVATSFFKEAKQEVLSIMEENFGYRPKIRNAREFVELLGRFSQDARRGLGFQMKASRLADLEEFDFLGIEFVENNKKRQQKPFASRDLKAEKAKLIERNKKLLQEKPEGYREKAQENAAKVKELNNNIEISERNAKNIKRYKEGEAGEPLREAAANQLLKDNTPIIETWFKKNFKKGLDVSESDFRSSMMEGVVKIFNSYNNYDVPFGYYLKSRLRPQLGNILRRAQAGRTTDIAMSEMAMTAEELQIADTSPELSRSGPEGPKGRELVRDLNIPEDVISKAEERLSGLDVTRLTYKTLKDLVPEYTNEILGVEPKAGNLGKGSVANAQKWFSKDSNARLFIDALPEGTIPMEGAPELVKGTSTGVQNTLLKEFYNSGGRVKTKAGAVIQNKIKGITPRQVKDYFGIKPDGSFVELKNDRGLSQKVKAAVDQLGKAWTNQVAREYLKNNSPQFELSTSVENLINQVQAGKSKSLASKDLGRQSVETQKEVFRGVTSPEFAKIFNANISGYGKTDKAVIESFRQYFKDKDINLKLETSTGKPITKNMLLANIANQLSGSLKLQGYKPNNIAIKIGNRILKSNEYSAVEAMNGLQPLGNPFGNKAGIIKGREVEFLIAEKLNARYGPGFAEAFLKSGATTGSGLGPYKSSDVTVRGLHDIVFGKESGGARPSYFVTAADYAANVSNPISKKVKKKNWEGKKPSTYITNKAVMLKKWVDGSLNPMEAYKLGEQNKDVLREVIEILNEAYEKGDINHEHIRAFTQLHSASMPGLIKSSASLALLPKGNPKAFIKQYGKDWVLEHTTPAKEISTLIYDYITSPEVGRKAKLKGWVKNALDNYHTTLIPENLDVMVNKIYQESLPPETLFDGRSNIILDRYHADAFGKGFDIPLYDFVRDIVYEKTPGTSQAETVRAGARLREYQKALFPKGYKEALASKDLNKAMRDVDKAFALGRKKNKKKEGMATFDFDETLIIDGENFVIAKKGKETVKISSSNWPIEGPKYAERGFEFDFSDFANVRGGKEGPLLQKMKNLIAKHGPKDVFVLTARQQDAAVPIHQWLKSQGIDIPLENITGLGKSQGEAKAQWMLEKFAEGYNDMYFVDDALPNVEAVKKVLDQLDIKSKVQQALASKDLSQGVNDIMKHSLDIASEKTFSKAEAKVRGGKIRRRRIFMTDSAADLELLLEPLYGKGKEGIENKKWFNENFMRPFERGYNDLNNAKQKAANGYMELRKQNKDVVKSLDKEVSDTGFTNDMAMRVYVWNKNGVKIPDLAKATERKLVEHVRNNPKLQAFAENTARLTGLENGIKDPSNSWWAETLASEIGNLGEGVSRKKHLAEWIEAKNEIFSEENLNKMESKLGSDWRKNVEEMFERMETGRTRKADLGTAGNALMDYLNGSVGTIMSLNTRSATLQLISSVNFVNHSFNNPIQAARAFANQKQYWKDFMEIMNSDMLKQRRAGLQINVTEAELAAAASGQKNKGKAALAWILKQGYIPTKICDSFAIASGGATYYRNAIRKYMKEGLSKAEAEKKAWVDFQAIAERTQQSSRPDLLSAQQVSVGGRIILPFANTPMQMNRIMMKELLDIKNGRYKGFVGDGSITNKMSKIGYYGFVQSAIFAGLQSGLFALMLNSDDDTLKAEKKVYAANTMADSFLRGMGIGGAVLAGVKNAILEFQKQNDKGWGADYDEVTEDLLNISPTVGSKVGKLDAAGNTYHYNKKEILKDGLTLDGPALEGLTMGVEAIANIPVNRVYRKIGNIKAALDDQNEAWQRILVGLGWSKWDVGIGQREKAEEKVEKDAQKKIEKEQKKVEEKRAKEEEKKAEEQKKKDEGFKQVRCSGIKSNGQRCSITIETKAKTAKCTYHKAYKPNEGSDRNNNGIKEHQCKSLTGSGKRCKNRTENKNKKCYAHQ